MNEAEIIDLAEATADRHSKEIKELEARHQAEQKANLEKVQKATEEHHPESIYDTDEEAFMDVHEILAGFGLGLQSMYMAVLDGDEYIISTFVNGDFKQTVKLGNLSPDEAHDSFMANVIMMSNFTVRKRADEQAETDGDDQTYDISHQEMNEAIKQAIQESGLADMLKAG